MHPQRNDAVAEVKKYYGNLSHPNANLTQIKIEAAFPKEVFEKRLNLTFFDPMKFNGVRYVKLMRAYQKELKPLRPLSLIIKEFVCQSKLSLGSNMPVLILAVFVCLQALRKAA